MTKPFRLRIRTGLGRQLDLDHASNRFVVVAAVLATVGTLGWRWATAADDVWLWAFRVGAGVFLAWAIGRELDPDDASSAGLAAVGVIPLMALGAPSLASSAAMLVAARISVRTTGISPHVIDGAVLAAGSAYLGARPETWPALGTLILAVFTDRYAHPPGPDRTLWFGAAMTVAAVGAALWLADPPGWTQPTAAEWVMVGVTAVAGFLATVNTRVPASRTDFHDQTVSESRLRFGRLLVVFTLVVGVVYLGGPVLADLTPAWAAALATTALHYFRLGQERRGTRRAS